MCSDVTYWCRDNKTAHKKRVFKEQIERNHIDPGTNFAFIYKKYLVLCIQSGSVKCA